MSDSLLISELAASRTETRVQSEALSAALDSLEFLKVRKEFADRVAEDAAKRLTESRDRIKKALEIVTANNPSPVELALAANLLRRCLGWETFGIGELS